MGLARSRTVTLVVAIATLTSNTVSSVLLRQVPDDPLHLARNFGWYLHLANILSVFGFIGALRQHALSIGIFSTYLILDTVLCAIPRFIGLGFLQQLSSSICEPSSSPYIKSYSSDSYNLITPLEPSSVSLPTDDVYGGFTRHWAGLAEGWTQEGCSRIVVLAQVTLAAALVAAMLLQFVGALYVREYAKGLWARELNEEGRLVVEEEDGPDAVLLGGTEEMDTVGEVKHKF